MDSYVVQKGDSLYNISKKVGLSTDEIIKRNGLPTSALKIGQILLLPKDGSRSDEETEESGDGEEMTGASQGEGERREPVAPPPLGKWSNLEERSLLVRVAKAFLGVPYKLGGSTLKGIDCSALVKRVYEIFNIQLPRTAREQFSVEKGLRKTNWRKGIWSFSDGVEIVPMWESTWVTINLFTPLLTAER